MRSLTFMFIDSLEPTWCPNWLLCIEYINKFSRCAKWKTSKGVFWFVGRQDHCRCCRRNPVRYNTSPRSGIGRRAETNLLILAAPGGFWQDRREIWTDLIVLLTGGRGFEAGGGGRLWGLPSGGGKAGGTFLLEKTGFSMSTKTLSSMEQIWSLTFFSLLSTTFYGPLYSCERGEEEASSWLQTQSLTKP